METLFTFGTSRQFPYQRGYVIINARTSEDAIAEFQLQYPNPVNSHLVNCSFWYTDPNEVERIKSAGNFGRGLHKYIDLMDTKKLAGMLYAEEGGLDTSDVDFDEIVTAEYISPTEFLKSKGTPTAQYYRFCKFLYDHIEVVDAENAVCNYTGFIEQNQRALRAFAKEHWIRQYPDKDDFCEAWIREFHGYLAGMVTEDDYAKLTNTLIGFERLRMRERSDINDRFSICEPSGTPIKEHLTKNEAKSYLRQAAEKNGNPLYKNKFSVYNENINEFVKKGRYDWENGTPSQNRSDVTR